MEEIDFNSCFFDVKTNVHKPNQIMARYSAMADLIDGVDKEFLVDALLEDGTAIAASQYAKKALNASELDSYRLPIKIIEDLLQSSKKYVLKKSYRYQVELLFYTMREYVPLDDTHWSIVPIFDCRGWESSSDKNCQNESI